MLKLLGQKCQAFLYFPKLCGNKLGCLVFFFFFVNYTITEGSAGQFSSRLRAASSHKIGILKNNSSSYSMNYNRFLVLVLFFKGNFLILLTVERKT